MVCLLQVCQNCKWLGINQTRNQVDFDPEIMVLSHGLFRQYGMYPRACGVAEANHLWQ